MERPRPAALAWGTLATAIIAYDLLSPDQETLSEGVDRALERPVGRYAALGGIALVAGHLANILPDQLDPIHLGAKHLRERFR